MVTFHSLPPEIRLMIYELALDTSEKTELDKQILLPMSSPRRFRPGPPPYGRPSGESKLSAFLKLQRVSKLIQAEVCPYFLSRNGFVVGSGPYGSSEEINMHGFRTFIRLVPAQYISFIRRIAIFVNLKTVKTNGGKHEFAFEDDQEERNLFNILRALMRDFKGLERVILTFGGAWPGLSPGTRGHDGILSWMAGRTRRNCCRNGPLLTESTAVGVAKAIKILLQHPTLEQIYFRESSSCRSWISLEQALKAILRSTPTRVSLHPIRDTWTWQVRTGPGRGPPHGEMRYTGPALKPGTLPIPERIYGREIPRNLLKVFGPVAPQGARRRSPRLKRKTTPARRRAHSTARITKSSVAGNVLQDRHRNIVRMWPGRGCRDESE